MLVTPALELIEEELHDATRKHGKFVSPHEGYAVILEELDELWTEIKRQKQDPSAIKKEAVQVAAMGLRFLIDCCE